MNFNLIKKLTCQVASCGSTLGKRFSLATLLRGKDIFLHWWNLPEACISCQQFHKVM